MVQILMKTYLVLVVNHGRIPVTVKDFPEVVAYWPPTTFHVVPSPEPYSASSSDIPHPLGSVDPQESVVAPRGCGDPE